MNDRKREEGCRHEQLVGRGIEVASNERCQAVPLSKKSVGDICKSGKHENGERIGFLAVKQEDYKNRRRQQPHSGQSIGELPYHSAAPASSPAWTPELIHHVPPRSAKLR